MIDSRRPPGGSESPNSIFIYIYIILCHASVRFFNVQPQPRSDGSLTWFIYGSMQGRRQPGFATPGLPGGACAQPSEAGVIPASAGELITP